MTITADIDLPLGKPTSYPESYDPGQLFAIPRSHNREKLGVNLRNLPFRGMDILNAYELSWLNTRGKPQVAIGQIELPANSPNIIESKSLKLYLNSFNQTQFKDIAAVTATIQRDLSKLSGADCQVTLLSPDQFHQLKFDQMPGICIDDIDVEIHAYTLNRSTLTTSNNGDNKVTETLHSHLLKSNCLVTGQPDWASVLINYSGYKIDRAGLLKYLISARREQEFHEYCVERIFIDILKYCQPEKLTVYACYTRRGGIDINPFRSNFEYEAPNLRLARQ